MACSSFADFAADIIEALNGQDLAPTFAFVDPFGYQGVSMKQLAELLRYSKCELFIYYDFNSVNRFATAGNVDHLFESLFGTDEFRNAPPAGDPGRGTYLHDLYEHQLREVAGFDYVQSFGMINETGHTGNYLFFCTRSLDGLDKMKTAMWKVAPAGDFRFDDRLVGQESLWPGGDTEPLKAALKSEFAGQTVPIEEIVKFVVASTSFTSGHVKRKTLAPLQRDGVITSPNQRRKNMYPAGTLVTFPPPPAREHRRRRRA